MEPVFLNGPACSGEAGGKKALETSRLVQCCFLDSSGFFTGKLLITFLIQGGSFQILDLF